jgi:hypothetical protein
VVAGVPAVFGGPEPSVWLDEEVRGQAEGGVPVPGVGEPPRCRDCRRCTRLSLFPAFAGAFHPDSTWQPGV